MNKYKVEIESESGEHIHTYRAIEAESEVDASIQAVEKWYKCDAQRYSDTGYVYQAWKGSRYGGSYLRATVNVYAYEI